MLSNAELLSMRQVIALLLPDTCIISALTEVNNGMGGVTQTWVASGTVSCRVDIKSGKEEVIGDKLQAFQQTVLSVPYDTTINTTDHVVHGGVTYNVTQVNNDQSWIAVRRAMLERV